LTRRARTVAATCLSLAVGTAACDVPNPSPRAAPQPTATTGPASHITANKATVEATVNPRGRSATYLFEYGTSTSYESTTPPHSLTGAADQKVTTVLRNLRPGTTYHFRVVIRAGPGKVVEGVGRTLKTSAAAAGRTGGVRASGNGHGTTGQQRVAERPAVGQPGVRLPGGYRAVRPTTGGYTTVPPTSGGYTVVQPRSTGR
jgi:phosphodiesterase/alkaline phosphatase D-like protein